MKRDKKEPVKQLQSFTAEKSSGVKPAMISDYL